MPPPSQPPHPSLGPSLCLSGGSLRAFLRLSRAAVDDPIAQHLSSLSHPASQPFDPATFSAARPLSPAQRALPAPSCAAFVSRTLFPAWAARARVLEYCAGLAEKGAPSTAGSDRSQWGGTIRGGSVAIGAAVVGPESRRSLSGREGGEGRLGDEQSPTWATEEREGTSTNARVVDERLDPYSARDYSDESPTERLARVVREEKSVEAIIRSRSWAVVMDRCGGAGNGWEEGMKTWEGEMGRGASALGTAVGQQDDPTSSQDQSVWGSLWRQS